LASYELHIHVASNGVCAHTIPHHRGNQEAGIFASYMPTWRNYVNEPH